MTEVSGTVAKARILVVDDEESIRKLLLARFVREGWEAVVAEDGAAALEAARQAAPDVILTDIKMPGLDGFQLVDAFRKQGYRCPIIMITGHGDKECAVEAVRQGAFDYLEKPFDMEGIALVVRRALEHEHLRRANEKLMQDLKTALEIKGELLDRVDPSASGAESLLVGKSSHVENLKNMARTVAESFMGDNDPVVLVTGESGVGKEVVARYMHAVAFPPTSGRSGRHTDRPFVAINCAAFPEHLLESELFGYEKGAFTGAVSRKLGLFELASGGTLFLDEIGEMDLRMQAKLLRVLQERVIRRLGGTSDIPVRPHIIAATNKDLRKAVADGAFREDLFYRLNTLPISVAPLRSRPEDIECLAQHFLTQLSAGRARRFTGFSPAAQRALQAYRWPGNVRELRSVVERAVILEKGPVLELSHLRQEHLKLEQTLAAESSAPADAAQGKTAVVLNFPKVAEKGLSELRKEMDERLVRQILIETLTHEHGNVSAVARILKLDRANLLRMLKRFRIEPEFFRTRIAS